MEPKILDSIAFIVQARLASVRAPRKMLRPFAGSTLTDITLTKIRQSRVIPWSQFWFAAREPELIEAAERHGANVFVRSEASMRSEGDPMGELYEWWDQLPHRHAVLISACAPLLTIQTIDSFVSAYLESESDGLFGVLERRTYFFDCAGKPMSPAPPPGAVMNTKFVSPVYEAAHCLYAGRLSLIGEGIWMGRFASAGDPALFVVPADEAVDIDTEADFALAERLYLDRTPAPKESDASARQVVA